MTDIVSALPDASPAAPTASQRRGFGRFVNGFALRSLVQALVTIWAATTFTFFLIRLLPSDPIQLYIDRLAQQEIPYEQAVARASQIFGTDARAPVLQQYVTYIGNIVRGSLGESLTSPGTRVLSIVGTFLPWTLFSVGLGLLLSFVVGLGFGMMTAYWRNSPFDVIISTLASFLSAVPNYLVAIIIMTVFGARLGLFNVGAARDAYSPGVVPGFTLTFVLDILSHAALPVTTYFLSAFGGWMLTMKNSTLGVLGEEYVNAANARGLGRTRIITTYVGRNAALPMVTQFALSIAYAVGGSQIIERYFTYPGIGLRLTDAITQRDYTTIQGIFLMITVSVVVANLLTDFLYSRLDPRVRTGR
jgi:peptide/nickel transport system permease protein